MQVEEVEMSVTQKKNSKKYVVIFFIVSLLVICAVIFFGFFSKYKSSKEKFNLFNNGLALMSEDGLYGYINKKDEIVIEPQYDFGYSVNGVDEAIAEVGDKQGIINKKRGYVVEPIYDEIGYYMLGLCSFVKDGKVGHFNTKGEVVIEPIFDAYRSDDFRDYSFYDDGYCVVEVNGGIWSN